MRYEDFILRIQPSAEGEFSVWAYAPAGEGRGTFAIPFSKRRLGALASVLRGGARELDRGVPAEALDPRQVGGDLFQALFQGEVANCFHESLGQVRATPGCGLRIRLVLDPADPQSGDLIRLPWELLYRSDTDDFLNLSPETPVVRHLHARRSAQLLDWPAAWRLLIVACDTGGPPLALEKERLALEDALRPHSTVQPVPLEKPTLESLCRAFRGSPFEVLHFMGHGHYRAGEREGALTFEDDDGGPRLVTGRSLATQLKRFKGLRLVFLNACRTADWVGNEGPDPFTGVASALVAGGAPAVLAMQGPVGDEAAVAFSRSFYQALADGRTLEEATTEGRLAVERLPESGAEWAVPVLFLRGELRETEDLGKSPWSFRAKLAASVAAVSLVGGLLLTAGEAFQSWKAAERNSRAVAFQQAGQLEEARTLFLEVLRLDSGNAAAHSNLALVEERSGRPQEALAHAQAAVEKEPESALFHYHLGSLYAHLQRSEEALASLQKAVELDPSLVSAYNELGKLYLSLQRPMEARRQLERGLLYAPRFAALHKNLGRTWLEDGDPGRAAWSFERALDLYGRRDVLGTAEATYGLALARERLGQRGAACQALQDLAAVDPDRITAPASDAARLCSELRCEVAP